MRVRRTLVARPLPARRAAWEASAGMPAVVLTRLAPPQLPQVHSFIGGGGASSVPTLSRTHHFAHDMSLGERVSGYRLPYHAAAAWLNHSRVDTVLAGNAGGGCRGHLQAAWHGSTHKPASCTHKNWGAASRWSLPQLGGNTRRTLDVQAVMVTRWLMPSPLGSHGMPTCQHR